MATWKELPRPATPGPWVERNGAPHDVLTEWEDNDPRPRGQIVVCEHAGPDAAAIAAMPEYVAEVDRLRAWVDWLTENSFFGGDRGSWEAAQNGEWPEDTA